MVQSYTIFGRQVGSHVLAMLTLGTVFGGSYLAMGGKKSTQTPPINASSKEEEDFIKNFIEQAQAEEQKEKAKH